MLLLQLYLMQSEIHEGGKCFLFQNNIPIPCPHCECEKQFSVADKCPLNCIVSRNTYFQCIMENIHICRCFSYQKFQIFLFFRGLFTILLVKHFSIEQKQSSGTLLQKKCLICFMSQNLSENNYIGVFFSVKLQDRGLFSCEFCKFFDNIYFVEHLPKQKLLM